MKNPVRKTPAKKTARPAKPAARTAKAPAPRRAPATKAAKPARPAPKAAAKTTAKAAPGPAAKAAAKAPKAAPRRATKPAPGPARSTRADARGAPKAGPAPAKAPRAPGKVVAATRAPGKTPAPASPVPPKPSTAAPAKATTRRPAAKATRTPAAEGLGVDASAGPATRGTPRTPAVEVPAVAPGEAPASPAPVAPGEATAEAPVAPAPPAPTEPARTAEPPRRVRPPRPRTDLRWTARELPLPHVGKPEDPRLAAAVAARERWHGRSGRPALKSGTQAVAFARDRRLVQATLPTPLPNLLDPIVGRACTPAEREEGPTLATFVAWRKELAAAHDLLELRLAFERPTLVHAELWPALVTVAAPREAAVRRGGVLPPEGEEALEILDRKGVVPLERLRALLGLDPAEMAHLEGELEARLLVFARTEVDEDHDRVTVLESIGHWAARAVPRRLEARQAWTLLFAAAVRAAVVLWPEEVAGLFPWSPEERETAIRACLQAGLVVTYDEGATFAYVASPVPR